jgi:hypothetical protein
MVVYLLSQKPSITKANFDRIEQGMTAKEVEAILGPAGYHTKRGLIVPVDGTRFRRGWIGDEAVITISFGPSVWEPVTPPFEEWQVREKEWSELPPEPLVDRLRRLIPW